MIKKFLVSMMKWMVRSTFRGSFKLMMKPYALMSMMMVGVVACGSNPDGDAPSPYVSKHAKRPIGIKLGKAYTIKGETYHPRYEKSYSEHGEASWYGPGFDGRMTASGERFDQEDITAAHRTLPLPSLVRVTRRDTGESIVVRINDRGPFAHDRIIDLSKGAARALNMLGNGVASVRVTYLDDETKEYLIANNIEIPDYMKGSNSLPFALASSDVTRANYAQKPPTVGYSAPKARTVARTPEKSKDQLTQVIELVSNQYEAPKVDVAQGYAPKQLGKSTEVFQPKRTSADMLRLSATDQKKAANPKATEAMFRIQAGAFSQEANAKKQKAQLKHVADVQITPIEVGSNVMYRVSLAPVKSYDDAMKLLHKTRDLGYKDAQIMVD